MGSCDSQLICNNHIEQQRKRECEGACVSVCLRTPARMRPSASPNGEDAGAEAATVAEEDDKAPLTTLAAIMAGAARCAIWRSRRLVMADMAPFRLSECSFLQDVQYAVR